MAIKPTTLAWTAVFMVLLCAQPGSCGGARHVTSHGGVDVSECPIDWDAAARDPLGVLAQQVACAYRLGLFDKLRDYLKWLLRRQDAATAASAGAVLAQAVHSLHDGSFCDPSGDPTTPVCKVEALAGALGRALEDVKKSAEQNARTAAGAFVDNLLNLAGDNVQVLRIYIRIVIGKIVIIIIID